MTFSCAVCDKEFGKGSGLNRHLRNAHSITPFDGSRSVFHHRCLESKCRSSFRTNNELIVHLQTNHFITIDVEVLNFKCIADFQKWKDAMEKQLNLKYVLHKTDPKKRYYWCNRSKRSSKNMGRNIRQIKNQGSCKLPHKCTSQILVHIEANAVEVSWTKTHYGHSEEELQHIPLSKVDKGNIAAKLHKGIPPARILQSVVDNITEERKRVDLLTLKDIANVRAAYRISDNKIHQNKEILPVDDWVEECLKDANPPVLYYKKKGEARDGFKDEDFVLIYMNKFQEQMLLSFGRNIIAIDGTHGLNDFDFELVTVMIVDELNLGFPVAFMFSNRTDSLVNHHLFQCLKEKVGVIKPYVFMGDVNDFYYNSFKNVMSPATHEIFCPWFVDRAWKSSLNTISSKDTRSIIHLKLLHFRQIPKISDFFDEMEYFVNELLGDFSDLKFADYFLSTFTPDYEKWAFSFHKSIFGKVPRINSMLQVIQYFHLSNTGRKSLDKSIDEIMKYLRKLCDNKYFDKIKGATTRQSGYNFKIHQSLTSSSLTITEMGHPFYVVKDAENNIEYAVESHDVTKCCGNSCSECQICIHSYTCDCVYFSNKIICSHIHFVHDFVNRSNENASGKLIITSQGDTNCRNNFFPGSITKNSEDSVKLCYKVANNLLTFSKMDENTKKKALVHISALDRLFSSIEVRDCSGSESIHTNQGSLKPYGSHSLVKCMKESESYVLNKLRRETTESQNSQMKLVSHTNSVSHDHSYHNNKFNNYYTYCHKQ